MDVNPEARDPLVDELLEDIPRPLLVELTRSDPVKKQYSLVTKIKAIRKFETLGSFRMASGDMFNSTNQMSTAVV